MEISDLNSYLTLTKSFILEDGIWYSSNNNQVSYPEGGYDECYDLEESSFWFKHRNECLIQIIKQFSSNKLFFDVGGGNGFTTKSLQDSHINAVLIEPGKSGVLNAKKRDVKNIICGTLSDLNLLEGQIPAIGVFDVVEHIEKDELFVVEIYKMLEENGVLYVTVPAFSFLWSDEDISAGHFRRYNKSAITKMLKKCNFEILYSSYFFSFLVLPLFIMRTIPSAFGIRKGTKGIIKKEHKQKNGFIGVLLNKIWRWELKRIKSTKKIPFGTSCLIVAKKKSIGNPI